MINETYFVMDISLPDKKSDWDVIIARYEKEILIKLLGYPLYSEFISGLAEETPLQKWLDLRNGADFSFEYKGKTISTHWNGLINDEKISLLAYYVYYKYRYNTIINTTSIGDVVGKSENSEKVSDVPKLVYAWNEMVSLYGHTLDSFSNDNKTYYNSDPSAYNFLLAKEYENWEFTRLDYQNSFGL